MDKRTNAPGGPELEDRILPWSQVKVISGLSRTTVWRMQKTGDFPASVQVSPNRMGWWQSEILEWRRSRIPRRLPEPKMVGLRTDRRAMPPAMPSLAATPSPNLKSSADAPVNLSRSPRKRRKSTGCADQTAFDF